MTGTINSSGGNTTIAFSYKAASAKIADVLGDASEYLWKPEVDDEGVVINPFSGATNQEKVDTVDAHVKSVILALANTFKSTEAQRVARETEKASEHDI